MEVKTFFRDHGGVYRAKAFTSSGRAGFRFMPLLFLSSMIPLLVLFLLDSPEEPQRQAVRIALVMMCAGFLGSLGVSIARHGAGVEVDPVQGTVTFRGPGQPRKTVPLGSLERVILMKVGDYASALFLLETGGKRHYLMLSRDQNDMRLYAQELASLTSLRLVEEEKTGNTPF